MTSELYSPPKKRSHVCTYAISKKQLSVIVRAFTYHIAIHTDDGRRGGRHIFRVIRRVSDADIHRFEGGFTFKYLTLMYRFYLSRRKAGERRQMNRARNGMQKEPVL